VWSREDCEPDHPPESRTITGRDLTTLLEVEVRVHIDFEGKPVGERLSGQPQAGSDIG
jgi:hypothetical protein